MGYMYKGQYALGEPDAQITKDGAWERERSSVRHWIGSADFPAETGRYHLFVAWNCPWAHRTLLARAIKGLSTHISVSVAKPRRTDQGWVFDQKGAYRDALFGASALHEIYSQDPMGYTGRLTVPLLWDKTGQRIVNNESADLVRIFNSGFGDLATGPDLAPAHLLDQIDAWNARIYRDVNNGVYRAGFAQSQEAYETGVRAVFAALDEIDAHLATHRFLCGDVFTEADLRLLPTLVRFDVAYHYAFKCNLAKIADYPNLWPYARSLYQMEGLSDTVKFDIYKQGYFSPSELRNPLGIVPLGPRLADWNAPHGRG